MDKEILGFVKEQTKDYDEAHGVDHALKVCDTCMEIAKTDFTAIDLKILRIAALVHDVCDHKFCSKGDKEEKLKAFLTTKVGLKNANRVMKIINAVSFSKENAGKIEKLEGEDEIIRIIVADADRIEAIGKVGIKRCYLYSKGKNPEYPFEEHLKHVIEHGYKKLLKLYPEKHIRTNKGREIAEPLHYETERIIKKLEEGGVHEAQKLINEVLAE